MQYNTDSRTYGEKLSVQIACFQHTNVHIGTRFDSQPGVQQIVANFMNDFCHIDNISSVLYDLFQFSQIAARLQLRMEHDDLSYVLWLKNLYCIERNEIKTPVLQFAFKLSFGVIQKLR